MRKENHLAGFTLAEILTTVIIVGVLAGLALPKYSLTVERSRTSEAIQILEALKNAQLAYYYEHNAYTNSISDLELSIPSPKDFNAPNVYNNASKVASIQRKDSSYTMEIDDTGTISCTGTICSNLGY